MIVDLILIIMIIYLIGFLPSFFSGLSSITIPDIATVVLAFATVVLAYYTFMLYQETKRMRLAQIQPEISIYISSEERFRVFYLTIKNIGPGAAHNIRFSVNPDFLVGSRTANKRLADLVIMRDGIGYMSPNQEFKFFLLWLSDYIMLPIRDEAPILDISVSYNSSFGETYHKSYHFDFSIFKDLIHAG